LAGNNKKVAVEVSGPSNFGPQDIEPLSRSSVIKQLLKLEAAIIDNHEQRRKYSKEPQK